MFISVLSVYFDMSKTSRFGGSVCCAYGCSKRQKKISTESYMRSNSDGSSDEESLVKRRHPRTFHR